MLSHPFWSRDKHWRAHRHRSCSSHNTTNQLPSAKLHSHSQESLQNLWQAKGKWIRCCIQNSWFPWGPNCSKWHWPTLSHVFSCMSLPPYFLGARKSGSISVPMFSLCLGKLAVLSNSTIASRRALGYQFLGHKSPYQDEQRCHWQTAGKWAQWLSIPPESVEQVVWCCY